MKGPMSSMSTQKRKIAKGYKDRIAIVRAAHKPEEYLKHRSHQKALIRAENEETAQREHEELLAAIGR